MARLSWLGGLVAIAAIGAVAYAIAFRSPEAPRESAAASCTQIDHFLSFCLNVPTSTTRRETTIPTVSLPSTRAEVRVETTIPGSDAILLAADVDRAARRVEALFGRDFAPRPRVLLFGTGASFATGARELFGYSQQTADYIGATYGGIFDRPSLTIALNWSASTPERMSAAIEHELGHLMIREVAGRQDVPVWLDEGIATILEEDAAHDEAWTADERLAGRAVASSRSVTLDQLESVSDFHSAYAALGRPLYAYVGEAVRAMETRIGWSGVVGLLAAVGAGDRVDVAYIAASGETVAALQQRIGPDAPTIDATFADPTGNVTWTLFAAAQNSDVPVRITSHAGYEVTFTVTTDALGMYRGSFGSTAAPGIYTVRAGAAELTFSTMR